MVGNLRPRTPAFVGRRDEVADVRRVLSTARLVTLTGVAGVGKTRLALQVGWEVRRSFGDGVWHVDLAELSDGARLEHLVSDALRLPRPAGRPLSTVLLEFVQRQRLLLVLDNCERALPACARLVAAILAAADRVSVLCTSRQPLRVAGEHVWPVPPLSLPDAAAPPARECLDVDSVALFAQRAAAADPTFTVTADGLDAMVRICRRLDGLPLAIELAAGRLPTVPLDRLADGQLPQHRALRAAFDRSFDLCTPRERALWTRTAVFVDGFDLTGAEYVGDGGDALEALSGLIDKSVVGRAEEAGRTRYRLLQPVRRYGLDRLREADGAEDAARWSHLDWCVRLAERFAADWWGPNQAALLARLRAEHANLRAALAFSRTAPGAAPTGLRLAACLYHFAASGPLLEGHRWLGRALATAGAPDSDRIRALLAYCGLRSARGARSAAHAREGLESARRAGDPYLTAAATTAVARGALLDGDLPAARRAAREAVARFAALGERGSAAACARLTLAGCALGQGEHRLAAALSAECRRLCAAGGDSWYRAAAHVVAARAALARDRSGRPESGTGLAEAGEHLAESLRLRRGLGDVPGLAESLGWSARVAGLAGDHVRAARLLGAAARLWRRAGRASAHLPPDHDECAARARRGIGDPAFARGFARGTRLGVEEAVADALGETACATGPRAVATQPLTAREWQVARLVADCLSNRQIADRLVLSTRTVDSHVESILRKLEFRRRAQVAVWVAERGGA